VSCALLGAAAGAPLGLRGRAGGDEQARARAITARCHAGALVLSIPVICATVLFADYRAVGIWFAVAGALAALLSTRDRALS
jgi:hypothetical protein